MSQSSFEIKTAKHLDPKLLREREVTCKDTFIRHHLDGLERILIFFTHLKIFEVRLPRPDLFVGRQTTYYTFRTPALPKKKIAYEGLKILNLGLTDICNYMQP
jgi:hypothetical protein